MNSNLFRQGDTPQDPTHKRFSASAWFKTVNLPAVLGIIGTLLMGLAGAMCIPLVYSIVFDAGDTQAFLISALITFVFGLLLYRYMEPNQEIYHREGFAVVSLVWIFFTLCGALPYMLAEPHHTFTDSIFETISGFTTTGASIFTDFSSHSNSIFLWRSITQWMGGMGIIVLGIAVLPALGIGGMQLFRAEVPGPTSDKLTPRIRDTAMILWKAYVTLTLVCFVLLWGFGMEPFYAMCHALAALSSGGFSPHSESIAYYASPAIQYILAGAMFMAGMNFALHYQISRLHWKNLFRDTELRTYFLIVLISVAGICLGTMLLGKYNDFSTTFRESLFTTLSIISTTGFVTADYETWPVFNQFIVLLLFLMGGCAGSTAGGFKIIRHVILFKLLGQQIKKLFHPKAIFQLRIDHQVIQPEIVVSVMAFLMIYLASLVVGTLIMTATGLDMVSAGSVTASCLGNIGPALGSLGPTDNYAHVSNLGKWVLSFLMLLGRLEILTVIVLFSPSFWRR